MASASVSEPREVNDLGNKPSNSTTLPYHSLTDEGQAQNPRAKPASSTPSYDPQALLNPTLVKRTRPPSSAGERETEGPGFSSMIEQVHNVEHRADRPQKRVKNEHGVDRPSPSFSNGGTPTPVGQFVRDQKEKAKNVPSQPPSSSDLVDLTGMCSSTKSATLQITNRPLR
jgi:hypothetical protein